MDWLFSNESWAIPTLATTHTAPSTTSTLANQPAYSAGRDAPYHTTDATREPLPPPPPFAAYPQPLAFSPEFLFGVATAPAHVEDQLDDAWLAFCREPHHCHAWDTTPKHEERLRFWSQPETEINLAADLGSSVFRMGVDWSRLAPSPSSAFLNTASARCIEYCEQPPPRPSPPPTAAADGRDDSSPCACSGVQDTSALARYAKIADLVRARGMKLIVTIFHHSLPEWVGSAGGWLNPNVVREFGLFSRDVAEGLGERVDFWLTMNEPMAFALFTYIEGTWPQALPKSNYIEVMYNVARGESHSILKAVDHLAEAHHFAYDEIHRVHARRGWRAPAVGMAARAQTLEPASFTDVPAVAVARSYMDFTMVDRIKSKADFLGLNYYGKEIVAGTTIAQLDDVGYSEAGRAIDTEGLYTVLRMFQDRYGEDPEASFSSYMITENGVADSTDVIRPAYITEHLAAIAAAIADGIRVTGYVHWTISDNWEWADGYCPKFGLISVDRESDELERTLRPSAGLFRDIASSRAVTSEQRVDAWKLVVAHRGEERPFCRSVDGKEGLDVPRSRPFSSTADWRFHEAKGAVLGGYFLRDDELGAQGRPHGLGATPLLAVTAAALALLVIAAGVRGWRRRRGEPRGAHYPGLDDAGPAAGLML